MRSPFARILVTAVVAVGVLSACGDDDGSSATPPGGDTSGQSQGDDTATGGGSGETADGDEDAWPPASVAGTGAAGTVTVNGVSHAIDATRSCDLTDFAAGDNRTREYWVQGIGLVDPEDRWADVIEISVFEGTTSNPEGITVGMRYRGPEGLYDNSAVGRGDIWTSGSSRLDEQPIDVDGDPITASMSLTSSLGDPAVEVVVEIARPTGDPVECD
ncbi:MAG: hypothetical protein ACXIVQ_08390 [Acidimicrobiales bacterium]